MAFKDVIDDYSNGATGTITTANGGQIGYTVSGTANTVTYNNHGNSSAQIYGDGSNEVTVTFDQPVEGASITLFGSNATENYYFMVDDEIVDLNTLIESGAASFENIGTAQTHKINEDGSLSGGHHTDGSVGQVVFHFPVISVGATGGGTGGWDGVEVGIDHSSFSAVCFGGETRLRSEAGMIRAKDVREGDRLWTLQGGFQPVVWAFQRTLSAAHLAAYPHLRPISIAAGALGQGLPHRRLLVSRQHRMLICSKIAHRVCGRDQVLVPAFRLLGLDGVTEETDPGEVTYVHVLLEKHHILDAEGAPAECLLVGPVALHAMTPAARAELAEIFPEALGALQPPLPACPVPEPDAQKEIAQRHVENHQPILQTYAPA